MKRILITNDDGYESEGLAALVDAVKDLGQVTVVAPATEKSACGHSLTLTKPLRFICVGDDFFKLDDGTPTDCVYLALNSIFEGQKPDLVLSGINKGSNMGEDITYSGTAAGAMEAALQGVPGIAISQVYNKHVEIKYKEDFDLAAHAARELATKVLDGTIKLGDRRFLNVNVPSLALAESKGFVPTRAGYRIYGNDAHMHRNPRGEEYYWMGLHPLEWSEYDDAPKEFMSDFEAVRQGYISVTPVKLEMTAYDELERLKAAIG